MLTIHIPSTEYYDEAREEFISIKPQTVVLEHSLISIAKWESKWKKPFLSSDAKTYDEMIDYIECMAIGSIDAQCLSALTEEQFSRINAYINDPMTATWFSDRQNITRAKKPTITAEIIYYDMIALQIPFECQKWHLNRLLTLIRVCEEKNKPPKKMGKQALMRRNSALNQARKSQLGTNG